MSLSTLNRHAIKIAPGIKKFRNWKYLMKIKKNVKIKMFQQKSQTLLFVTNAYYFIKEVKIDLTIIFLLTPIRSMLPHHPSQRG